MQLQSFLDDVVEDVNEGVFTESGVNFVELEGESGEAFRDLGYERVGPLLILFVGGDEVVVEAEWGVVYGF